MPRKHRSAREREGPAPLEPPRGVGPLWAQRPGFEAREVLGEKVYRCPGCDHEIRRGVSHLVVVPTDDPGSRRHWHTECWRRELRRRGGR